jgi:hypothetical protein
MQQEKDYLKKQIDQLGIVLRKVLSDLLGLKQQGLQEDVIEMTNKELKSEIDLDLNEFIAILTMKR